MRGFTPEQLVELNTHRTEGRRVHAVRPVTALDVAVIALASAMTAGVLVLAWHIFSVAMGRA